MKTVLLDPDEGMWYRLAFVIIGGGFSLGLAFFTHNIFAFIPLCIGFVLWAIFFHLAWKGKESK